MANSIDVTNMSLEDVQNMEVPSDPQEALSMLKSMYKQAEQNALQREIMSLLHKLIMDAIKKIGQAA